MLGLAGPTHAAFEGPQVHFGPVVASYDHGSGRLVLDFPGSVGQLWLGAGPPFAFVPFADADATLNAAIDPGGSFAGGDFVVMGKTPTSDPTRPLLRGTLSDLRTDWQSCFDGACRTFTFFFGFDVAESQVPGFPTQGEWVSAHFGSYDRPGAFISNANLFTESFTTCACSYNTAILPRVGEPAGVVLFVVGAAMAWRWRRISA
ncbi:MAG: hypothetical protein AB7O97_24415 [Planctomycetota bacterium]